MHANSFNYSNAKKQLTSLLRIDDSFDLVKRDIITAGKASCFFFIDGFVKDELMQRILAFTMKLSTDDLTNIKNNGLALDAIIPYVEVTTSTDINDISTQILSGVLCLLVDGFDFAILIDARTYPVRGMDEPESDRVLRGSRDGFVETLVFNTALIRRRFREPSLTMKYMQVGTKSHTDIVISYLEDKVDKNALSQLVKRLKNIKISTLTLSPESLAECILPNQPFNPFPRIRYTERPDTASASIAEGNIVVIIDNSPSVMILPTYLLAFVQDTNDYYFPPIVGTFLKWIRIAIYFFTLLFTPTWVLLQNNPELTPKFLEFMIVNKPMQIPLVIQLLIIEFVIEALRLASQNTPSSLSNSFSVVGALILGEFAINAKWFIDEAVLYMAFVAISNFAQPSFELGYAFKICRIFILILTGVFGIYGYSAALLLVVITLFTTKTISGYNYLYPLIPFNGKKLYELLVRVKINKNNN